MTLRPFGEDDAEGLADLVDDDSDRLWVSQGHTLHGPDRDGDRWRRTIVADHGGTVVGAATVARNRVHPGRYNLAVEVAASHRRAGIAAALVAAVRGLPPDPFPLSGKVPGHSPTSTRRRGRRPGPTSTSGCTATGLP